jgi:hypothetical protein
MTDAPCEPCPTLDNFQREFDACLFQSSSGQHKTMHVTQVMGTNADGVYEVKLSSYLVDGQPYDYPQAGDSYVQGACIPMPESEVTEPERVCYEVTTQTSGAIVDGSNTITVENLASMPAIGNVVSGDGIPVGATVISVDADTLSFKIDLPATATVSAQTITFGYVTTIAIYALPSDNPAMPRMSKAYYTDQNDSANYGQPVIGFTPSQIVPCPKKVCPPVAPIGNVMV